MDLQVQLSCKENSYIIKNLYPLYLHDLSEHYGFLPNCHGVFEESDDYKTLSEQNELHNIWWEKPEVLFPFLILVDERPAGFILIATPPHCTKGIDYFVNEFFLLRPFRGKGLAEHAASIVFDQFRGKWELFTNPSEKNIVGQKFWRRTILHYSGGNYDEEFGETFDGYKLIFKFDNSVV
ncbi:GNAT family N-acetyltransferase [Anaerobacillus sp. CMMVII]|uniref:GNAT family N-acetyltransferase n=1 Tax=Anaerobacillus sp. CMMVII TaxID=2755588 RepID=UPI0021B7224F|nr:GNAT family N-acetyltransferase [Anaerobacillus sp. CMMVII]MCT8138430.1 GNAT family N-acetyltransferase [Anaerobacillus sp. CMMVII]